MSVLFVITARGGSKGVPRKNIREIGGLPLIAYKIISAKRCATEKRIIVSTDDDEIAEVARRYGAETPFRRPAELATDDAGSMEVIDHAVNWVIEHEKETYDYICMLEPSSPFATYEDFDNALKIISEKDADTLLGMKQVDVGSVFIHELDSNGGLALFYQAIKDMKSVRRQDQKKEFTMNGCMYMAKWDYFLKHKMFHSENSVPFIMSDRNSIEIDSMLDYEFASYLVEKGVIDTSFWK